MLKSLRDNGYTVKTLLNEQAQNGQTNKKHDKDVLVLMQKDLPIEQYVFEFQPFTL